MPVTVLKGIGSRVAERLARLNIATLQDLLFHLPVRYQDRTRVVPMGAVRSGQQVVVEGSVDLTEIKFGRRRNLLVRISDGTGSLCLRFFHFNAAQHNALQRGKTIRCFGEIRSGASMSEMIHPEYQLLDDEQTLPVDDHLTAFYPSTEGVHQLSLRNFTDQALVWLDEPDVLPEYLPDSLCQGRAQISLVDALRYVHRPPVDARLEVMEQGRHQAQQRLILEELLAHHLSMRRLRQQATHKSAPCLQHQNTLFDQLCQALPFELTAAQQRVIGEIGSDLAMTQPMMRLVQGDVGSGKTLVAAFAALQAVSCGRQAALMAPTEILAEQHFCSFRGWLQGLGVPLAWLSGKTKKAERNQILEQLAQGEIQLIVGTHALFQDDIQFANLAVVIVDEQHRFGVHQRLALRNKGVKGDSRPHQLIMTATPIPRTLAMAVYADLDVSVIDELPPGRTPINTVVMPDTRRGEVVERVQQMCAQGRQVYWVCTLIEESESLQCQAAEDMAQQLVLALPNLRIGLVHGRLKPAQKEQVMRRFKQGEIDLLVATTVIEVGVDVANASLMVIDNAERLGLAQLHQLRGRVGRGQHQSYCVMMYKNPLSAAGRARLGVLRESCDGFEIARKDLELRGPGEVLGTRQTGMLQMRIADLMRDQYLMEDVVAASDLLIQQQDERVEKLIHRWLGDDVRYGEV
ncbi:MAG: ATP-dependent DNA helicase RecG [Gammaproteobacteria bacterium]|nr:ATP-dependent DNA helicase RecG [Gammaproteobacteria bacterium]